MVRSPNKHHREVSKVRRINRMDKVNQRQLEEHTPLKEWLHRRSTAVVEGKHKIAMDNYPLGKHEQVETNLVVKHLEVVVEINMEVDLAKLQLNIL